MTHELAFAVRAEASKASAVCVGLFVYCACLPADWIGHIWARPKGSSCSAPTLHMPCWEFTELDAASWKLEPSIDASKGGHFHTPNPAIVKIRAK